MAVGDSLQQLEINGSSSTHSGTFGATPTSGNLLFLSTTSGNSARTISSVPTGFTLVTKNDGDGAAHFAYGLYYKESDGSESGTLTVTWNSTANGRTHFWEVEWGLGTPTVSFNKDETNKATAVTSQGTGSVTPDNGSSNVTMSVLVVDEERNWNGTENGSGWTNATNDYRASTDNYTQSSTIVSARTNVSGSTSDTYTTDDTGDSAVGAIVAFSAAAASGASPPVPPLLTPQLRTILTR